MITVAVDCMGGDHGPHVTVPAALEFLARAGDVDVVLVGRREAIEAELTARGKAAAKGLRVHHAAELVAMDEPPAQALRYKKDSSMRVAVNLVKSGEAHACVSAGNTGALMAISRFVLKTIPGIDRPAIAAVLPNMKGGFTYVLDLGANVECTAEQLMQFGVMGAMLVGVSWTIQPLVWLIPLMFLGIRPIATFLSLLSTRTSLGQRAILGWFGVRGVGSLYYLAYALTHGLSGDDARTLTDITLAVVAASVVLHGISVTPLMALAISIQERPSANVSRISSRKMRHSSESPVEASGTSPAF